MGFWHTGYMEFHELTGLPRCDYVPSRPRFACELCEAYFEDLKALRQHKFESHRIQQPALYIHGKSVGSVRAILLTPLCKEDVAIINSEYCTANGKQISLDSLVSFLVEQTNRFVTFELHNHGATSRFNLDFRVASDNDLTGVEQAFLGMVGRKSLSPFEVSSFNSTCRDFPSALQYCDGIAQFLYGMLAKEGHPDCSVDYSKYIEKFYRASEALKVINRPLSRAIRAVIAFHLNQFEEAESLAPCGDLRVGAGIFSSLIQGFPLPRKQQTLGTNDANQPETPRIFDNMLSDVSTQNLINWTLLGSELLTSKTDELLQQLESGNVNDYDRLKLIILVCETLTQSNDPTKQSLASSYGREICNLTDLQMWWTQYQEKVNP